jgi:diguanylate cyclase (GGDEF)-like protein/PAS domain S-box-containing protein
MPLIHRTLSRLKAESAQRRTLLLALGLGLGYFAVSRLSLALLRIVAGAAPAHGLGPFGSQSLSPIDDTLMFQTYLGVGAVCTLFLAAIVADRRRVASDLLASDARYAALRSELPDTTTALYDRRQRCVFAEGTLPEQTLVSPSASVGQTLAELWPERATELAAVHALALLGEPQTISFESPDGRSYELDAVPYRPDGPEPEGVFMVIRDRTEQHHQQRSLRRAEARLRTIFESAPIGYAIIATDGGVTDVNQALAEMLGYPQATMQGINIDQLVHPKDLCSALEALTDLTSGRERQLDLEIRALHQDGHSIFASVRASRMTEENGERRALAQIVDITNRKLAEERLQFLAEHDPMTGLANRRRLQEKFDLHLAQVRRLGPTGAVMVLDVDDFKMINDTRGHRVGDRLIVSVAHALSRTLRANDLLTRLGGDEFAILLRYADREAAETVAAKLVRAIGAQALECGADPSCRVTISVGVTMIDSRNHEHTYEAILAGADAAMYEAKRAGGDRHEFFAGDLAGLSAQQAA